MPKLIPVDLAEDEWTLIVSTLDQAYPERPSPDSPDHQAYLRYEKMVNKLHKARQEAP